MGACCLLAIAAGPAGADFKLLDPLEETKIESIEKFVAAEAFRIGSRVGGKTLSAVGLNFTQHFISVVENDVPAASLGGWALQYTTGDKSLIKALGGEQEVAVPFLAYIHRVMEMGKDGVGHADWRSNFAYVRSPIDQRLWAVHWTVNYANEWNIGAVSVPHQTPRLAGWLAPLQQRARAYSTMGLEQPYAPGERVASPSLSVPSGPPDQFCSVSVQSLRLRWYESLDCVSAGTPRDATLGIGGQARAYVPFRFFASLGVSAASSVLMQGGMTLTNL